MAEQSRVIDREPRAEKVSEVEEITERFREAEAALLTEYRGLRVAELAELRNSLREVDTSYKVLKNTLARIAARELGLEDLVGMLEGPTAIAFVRGDAVAAAKALDDAARKYPVLVVKGGILKGRILSADQARDLATVEPREVQLAKIAMLANFPVQQTVNVFAAVLRDFGSMLAQVVAKKESGELPSPAAGGDGGSTATAETGDAEGSAEGGGDADGGTEDGGAEAGGDSEAAGGDSEVAGGDGSAGADEPEDSGAATEADADSGGPEAADAAEGAEAAPGPAEGNGDPGPAEGNGDPGPAEGNTDPAPAEGNGDSGPAEGNTDPALAEGNGDPGAAEGNGDPGAGADGDDKTAAS